jgi:hypothetical protein
MQPNVGWVHTLNAVVSQWTSGKLCYYLPWVGSREMNMTALGRGSLDRDRDSPEHSSCPRQTSGEAEFWEDP